MDDIKEKLKKLIKEPHSYSYYQGLKDWFRTQLKNDDENELKKFDDLAVEEFGCYDYHLFSKWSEDYYDGLPKEFIDHKDWYYIKKIPNIQVVNGKKFFLYDRFYFLSKLGKNTPKAVQMYEQYSIYLPYRILEAIDNKFFVDSVNKIYKIERIKS
jgi:hypothetical protein